jgi:hypothetical protein
MEKSLIINIGTPSHGWLPIDFFYDGLKLEIHASDVLNDPIEEIYRTITRLREGKTGQIMCWLEPSAYYFYFEKKSNEYVLTISETDDIHNAEDKRKIIRVINGSYTQIVAPFEKPLMDFCSKTYENKHWPYKLDEHKMLKLKANT